MEKSILFFAALIYMAIAAQAQNPSLITNRYVEPLPYWVDTITAQPEGYVTDAEGNVEISSSDGLVWLISAVNGLNGCDPDDFDGRTVRLANDIDFGEVGMDYRFTPIGTRETPFTGTFDGQGYRIHRFKLSYSKYEDTDYLFDMGLFGYIRNAKVMNVIIDSTSTMGSTCNFPDYYRGCLVGFADSLSTVDNCHIHCHRIGFDYGGVLVGMNRNSAVRNCVFGGRNGWYHYSVGVEGGGLVYYNRSEGGYSDAVVENCYFHGKFDETYQVRYLGGLVCFNETVPNDNGKQAIVRNCHFTPTRDFYAPSAYGSFTAVLSSGSGIRNCYADFTRMYQFTNMVGLNEGGEMKDCSSYINIDGVGTLANPVTLNGTTTTNLVDALNLWIAEQEHPELYRTWTMVTDTVPVFGDYYIGIAENKTPANKVKVYPNPASGHVSIQSAEATEVKVYNTLGQCVKTVQNTNEISLEGLPQGVYLLRVTTKDGSVFSDKVVKN